MARAKMTKGATADTVTVKVTKSFDGLIIGETMDLEVTDRVQALIGGAFLEVTGSGKSPAGPVAADAGDPGGEPESPETAGSAGAEPGEDPSAG